jgi:hypothetical protein
VIATKLTTESNLAFDDAIFQLFSRPLLCPPGSQDFLDPSTLSQMCCSASSSCKEEERALWQQEEEKSIDWNYKRCKPSILVQPSSWSSLTLWPFKEHFTCY